MHDIVQKIFENEVRGTLDISSVVVPAWVEAGTSVELRCAWSPAHYKIWALKWYQGLREIYRYTPSNPSPVQVFHNPHLAVDAHRSTGGSVRLENVTLGAAGLFRCEVSAEAPTFKTVYGEKELRVIALPPSGPTIRGVAGHYQEGDWVDLTCSLGAAHPVPHLSFTVNGRPPPSSNVEPQIMGPSSQRGLRSSSIRLRFVLRRHHLYSSMTSIREGVVDGTHVRCMAELPTVDYRASTEVVLSTRPSYQAAGMGGRTSSVSSHFLKTDYTWAAGLVRLVITGVLLSSLQGLQGPI
ncbi:Immunoglobulin-like domain [Trinorchestia longiramus]|nr:Immunoglobulin-like domain [Trinorchestia longiramus]